MQIKTNLNSVRCKAVNRSFISMQLTIFLMDYPNAPLNPTPQPPNFYFFKLIERNADCCYFQEWVIGFYLREIIHTEC